MPGRKSRRGKGERRGQGRINLALQWLLNGGKACDHVKPLDVENCNDNILDIIYNRNQIMKIIPCSSLQTTNIK